eukprot:1391332-Amphidinium_carterae.1
MHNNKWCPDNDDQNQEDLARSTTSGKLEMLIKLSIKELSTIKTSNHYNINPKGLFGVLKVWCSIL